MTQNECNEAIGKLVKDYADNETRLVALRRRVDETGTALRVLGKKLERPEDVPPAEATAVDLADLKSLLVDFHQANDDKTRMEANLEQAGLGNLIRKK